MPYNPEKHHRRSIRLKGYDYTQPGAYFITVCTYMRECLFGEVVDGQMRLNAWGQIVEQCWREIPIHFPHVALDAFVVMPNHIHGIIVIGDVGATHASPLHQTSASPLQPTSPSPLPPSHPVHPTGPSQGSVGAIVGSFKSVTTRRINALRGTPGAPVWQRNYYEHIIRNEPSLQRIREYIAMNPLRWHLDRENPDALGTSPEEARWFR